jgi:hypothetical protein
MIIKYNGNVGIGTAAPATTLDVNGDANVEEDLTVGGDLNIPADKYIEFGSLPPLSAAFDHKIRIQTDTSGETASISGFDFKNTDSAGQVRFMLRDDLDNYMIIGTANSESNAGDWLGIPREDGFFFLQYSPATTAKMLGVGTITAGDVVLGANNTEYIRLDVATTSVQVSMPLLAKDKIIFTQTDGNEYIDSLNDGYLDLGATTGIRLLNDSVVTGFVDASTGFKDNGTAGIDTTFVDADGNTITVSGGIITAKTAP